MRSLCLFSGSYRGRLRLISLLKVKLCTRSIIANLSQGNLMPLLVTTQITNNFKSLCIFTTQFVGAEPNCCGSPTNHRHCFLVKVFHCLDFFVETLNGKPATTTQPHVLLHFGNMATDILTLG